MSPLRREPKTAALSQGNRPLIAAARGSHTHFLPGSSEEGHVWPGASLSGSCPPGTPSFSVKVDKTNEQTINFFNCISGLLGSEDTAEAQSYTETHGAKDEPSIGLHSQANLELAPPVPAERVLLCHHGPAERLAAFRTSGGLSCPPLRRGEMEMCSPGVARAAE